MPLKSVWLVLDQNCLCHNRGTQFFGGDELIVEFSMSGLCGLLFAGVILTTNSAVRSLYFLGASVWRLSCGCSVIRESAWAEDVCSGCF